MSLTNSRFTAFLLVLLASSCSLEAAVKSIRVLKQSGGRLDWSKTKDLIAYDRMGADNFFDIWVMKPDATGDECLTCDKAALPGRHVGNPSWHPGGDWIVFQAQKDVAPLGAITDAFSNPGSGLNNDVWIMDARGQKFWRITDVAVSRGGVLHPHFSPDGTKLAWAERIAPTPGRYGLWEIQVADFAIVNNAPVVSNTKTYRPGAAGTTFYETHGFTPDSDAIVFSGNLQGQDELFIDIYRLNLATGQYTDLTPGTEEWNEHAQLSPAGSAVIWMSSRGVGKPTSSLDVRTDYWVMNVDGSEKERLTYFNDPANPAYIRGGAIAADSSWSPTGDRLIAYLILDPRTVTGLIVMIEFDWPATTVSSARYTAPIAAGMIASVYGRGLASKITAAESVSLPLVLDRTKLVLTDSLKVARDVPLFFATPGQVNYLVPPETAMGPARLDVFVRGILVGSGTIDVRAVAPGLYTANQDGRGVPAAYVQRVASDGNQSFRNVFVCDAADGSVFLQLFGTGIRGRSSLSAVTVTVRGMTLPVLFAGPHTLYPGLDQLSLQLPASLVGAGQTELTVNVDGVASNAVSLSFR